ncbi:MAG: SWIM zinc finger domain-containing protein [Pseudomonadales bacterium]
MIDVSDSLLQRLAGEAAFARGSVYYSDQRVGDLRQAGKKIFAEVAGNENYSVSLVHTERVFEGSCTCPASDNIDFCKHCVAVALQYRSQRSRLEQQLGGSGADRLQAYLESLDKKELIAQLNEFIVADKVSFEAWSIRADQALNVVDFKSIRKRITTSIPYNRQIYRYAQVSAYFARVATVVELLADVSKSLSAEQLLQLCDYSLQRMARALETVDDSGGYRFESLELLETLHKQAFLAIDWPAQAGAEYLLEYFLSDRNQLLPDLFPVYLGAIPEEGLAQFEANIASQWQELPPMDAGADSDTQHLYRTLQAYLLQAAEKRGDIDGAIKIKTKTAVETYDYLALFDYCLNAGRSTQAEEWLIRAEQGEKNRQYNTDILKRHRIDLHEARGELEVAADLQWQRFKQQPRLESYNKLLDLTESRDRREYWRLTAQNTLQQQLETSKRYGHNPAASLLIRIYLQDDDISSALQIAEQHNADDECLLSVARKIPSQAGRALKLYMRVAEQCVSQGNNDSYQKAVDIVLRSRQILGEAVGLQWQEQLELIREKHKAKRNFLKFLDKALAE